MSRLIKTAELETPQLKKSGHLSILKSTDSSDATRSTSVINNGSRKMISSKKNHKIAANALHVLGRKQVETFVSEPLIGKLLPSSLDEESASLSLALNVLIEYLTIYGFDPSGFRPRQTLNHWELCSKEIGWMKFLKYKFAAFFSAVINDELPPKPFQEEDKPLQLVGSSAGRFIRCMLKKKNRLEFAIGILYLKKGMPRPSSKAVEKQVMKTYELLTSTHEPGPCVYDDISYTLDDLIVQVQRTARELFDKQRFEENDMYTPYAPSVKANYVNTRQTLGTFGVLSELDDDSDRPILRDLISSEDYQGNIFNYTKEEQREQDNIPEYELNPKFEYLVKSVYRSVYETVRNKAFNEPCKVELVGLSEALKVRVISKGPPLTYFCLKPIQKFMHGVLRRHNVFKFIGKPANSKDILDSFKQFSGKFLSVDYSAATDMLNPILSRSCANAICTATGIPKDLQTLFLKALTGHSILKPKNKMFPDEAPEIKEQVWGQLMGSIVSFPILCIVNAAVCRRAYEIGMGKPFLLSQIPLMINGDDALLRCNDRVRDCWNKLALLGGLEPSIGKVYFSDTYLNINSTSYTCEDSEQQIIEHPYVNMGLVKGLSRSEGVLGKKDAVQSADSLFDSTIGSRHRDLMKSCPSSIRVKTHILFVQNHWAILKGITVPWYVPESLGGLGMCPLVQVNGEEEVLPFSSQLVNSAREFNFFEYEMTSRRDGVKRRLRIGPSELDLKCVRLLMNNVLKLPYGKVPGDNPVISRDVWFQNKGFRANLRFVTQIDDEAWVLGAAIKVSQSDVFSFLDTAAYYLTPSFVSNENKDIRSKQIKMLRKNERAWEKLSNLAKFKFSGFAGFEFIAESMSVHPFFCSLRSQGSTDLKRIQDMSHDQFSRKVEQLFDITGPSDSLEEGKHKDLIEKLVLD